MNHNNIRKYLFDYSPVGKETGADAFKRCIGSRILNKNAKGNVTTMIKNAKFTDMDILLGSVAGFDECLFINCHFLNSATTTYKDCVFINPTFIKSVHASIFEDCIFEGICMVNSNNSYDMFNIEIYAPFITNYNLSLRPSQTNKNVLRHSNKSLFAKIRAPNTVRTKKVTAMHIPTVENFFIDTDTKQIAARSVSGLARKSVATGLTNPRHESRADRQESMATVNRTPSISSPNPVLQITDANIKDIIRSLKSDENCIARKIILGFTKDNETNSKVFKNLMIQIHPDRHPNNENYAELTKLVTQTFTNCIKYTQRGGTKKRKTCKAKSKY